MKKDQMDMVHGPIAKKMIAFAVPVMLSGILQLLFNTADNAVIGHFAGHSSLAAVGSTAALTQLLVNLMIGLSVGTNVVTARFIGKNDDEMVSKSVHTAISISMILGVLLVFLGYFASGPLLELMKTPREDDVLQKATLYMRIYFAGMPISVFYNFGSAILRAAGDTKRPLYYLLIAGAANVLLNLLFVIAFQMDVAGVALATVLSQIISSVLVARNLMQQSNSLKLDFRNLRMDKRCTKEIVKVGLPAGLQGMIFSVANMTIQSAINSFGEVVMAGSVASHNVETYVYTSMNSLYQATVSFTSQNLGAMQYKRIRQVRNWGISLVVLVGGVLGAAACLLGPVLLRIFTNDEEVLMYGLQRLRMIAGFYFLCGIMDVLVGSLRGMGHSFVPMVVSIAGACGFRLFWIYAVFSAHRSIPVLFACYPLSFILTSLMHSICLFFILRRMPRHDFTPEEVESAKGLN